MTLIADITLVHKDTQKCILIDIAVQADQNIIRRWKSTRS